FKGQQFRWAKGSVQTAMKLLPELLRSRAGRFIKLQAAIHLTNHAVYPLLLLLALFSLPAVVLHQHEPMVRPFFVIATLFVIASLGHPLLYLDAQRRLKPDWPRQLALMPILIALGMGIAVNNVRAVVEALAGIPSGFNRTPKYDLRQSTDDWRGKRYRVPATAWPLLEMALGAWTGTALLYTVVHGQWLATPFLALYAAGFLSVGGASLLRTLDAAGGVARTA
ncbi:MAG: glycosyl transferase, group 2 family, partial [bacterium]